ncbi:MAG: RdgB/HAM1 family non-canonical purine NTP pyrophosphatase [Candidatus Nanopelagicaceae bacterium]|nr:RdgB/HAM1 family non-canonical purine NTP pyrophosphatase [Candidatus Nanopelagicaceae bacterium]
MKLILATRNHGKIVELQRIIAEIMPDVELVGTDSFPDLADVEETEDSFIGNALLKAHAVAKATGLPAIADDSGLSVNSLNGAPGIFSARYAGTHGDDLANLNKVLSNMDGVTDRSAAFHCAAAFAKPDGFEIVVEAKLHGRLTTAPIGDDGFGYDPIFIPDGFEITTAQMSPVQKDQISHRGMAFRALIQKALNAL